MFVTTPTNFTPANPLEYPKFPRHVRAEIGRRLFREKNPLGTTEPWTRSSEENVVCPRTMRYPRDLPPPLCPIRDVGSVESVVQFQPRRLKVKLVVSRFSVNEKFSSRMQPRLSRAITGLIMEISIPEWFWREKYALISVFSNINLVINDSVRFLLGVVKKFNYTRRECLIGLGNFFLFFLSQISLIKFLWFIDM